MSLALEQRITMMAQMKLAEANVAKWDEERQQLKCKLQQDDWLRFESDEKDPHRRRYKFLKRELKGEAIVEVLMPYKRRGQLFRFVLNSIHVDERLEDLSADIVNMLDWLWGGQYYAHVEPDRIDESDDHGWVISIYPLQS